METFSALLALCGEFPSQRPVARNFDFFYLRTNNWVNNWDAGDSIRHRTHYDVIAMVLVMYVYRGGWIGRRRVDMFAEFTTVPFDWFYNIEKINQHISSMEFNVQSRQ